MKLKALQTISIGSGKGGVGKSLVTSNLAYHLAEKGYKVVLADFDFGGADLAVFQGVFNPKICLSDFLEKKVATLNELVLPSQFHENLFFIAGAGNTLSSANLAYQQKIKIIQQIRKLDADIVLLDVGAGTHFNVLDFFLEADHPLVLGIPQPTSIFDLSRFIKLATIRFVARAFARLGPQKSHMYHTEFNDVKHMLESTGNFNKDKSLKAVKLMRSFKPELLVNMSTPDHQMHVDVIRRFLKKFSGQEQLLGLLPLSPEAESSVHKLCPVKQIDPSCDFVKAIKEVADKVTNKIEAFDKENNSEAIKTASRV